ncbi:cyclin-like protein, partial [Ramicandelaber brevisporus]
RRTQWHFRGEDLSHTPTLLEAAISSASSEAISASGISNVAEAEKLSRSRGCNMIIRIAMSLRLPVNTIATATTLFHRFYMRRSLTFANLHNIATTSLFVACKIEETTRKLHDVIIYAAQKAAKDDKLILDVTSREYQNWKNVILTTEAQLLETCCFDMEMDHPHNHIIELANKLKLDRRIAMRAWSFANDSLLTTLCLTHSPRVVAAAAL